MNKQEIYDYLAEKNIHCEIVEHKAVYNMAEAEEIETPYPDAEAKNLFLCDNKKENFYLITVKGDKRVNLKEFKHNNGTRPLKFASEAMLWDILSLTPGSVTPFGVLNDKDVKVQVFFDEDFFGGEEIIGVHPNDNTASVYLKINDLIDIIKEHGNSVNIIKITEREF